jgi:hypothetical protein
MILSGLTTAAPGSTSFTSYLGPFQTGASNTNEGSVQMVMPVGGTISNLAVNIGTSPGSGRNWVLSIRKNGSTTAVTCKIEGSSAKTCTSNASVTFAAGDLISLEADPSSASPSSWSSLRWSVTLTE